MKEYTKINSKDLRLTILGCFRYSLGRMTYMPLHISSMIINCKEVFRKEDWESIIKGIKDCKSLGMACDKDTWYKLKIFCEDELLKIGKKGT